MVSSKKRELYEMKTLRDYQVDAIEAARNIIREGKSPLLVAPTGAGKTGIGLSIAGSAISKGCRVLIVIPLNPILRSFYHESVEWIENLSYQSVGILAGSDTSKPEVLKRAKIIVAMAQTIESRRGENFSGLPWAPDIIIYDEAHRSLFREAYTILNNLFTGVQEIAVTATPVRLDGADFPPKFKMHQVTTTARLIERGYLTPYKAFKLGDFIAKAKKKKSISPSDEPSDTDNQSIVKDEEQSEKEKDFTVSQMNQIVDFASPAKVYEEWLNYQDKHTIAFVPSKKVGEVYVKYFQGQGKECILITEKMSTKQREEAYRRFREEKIILFSIIVLAEGFDEPCATVCLLLRPTQSLALLIQMIGRVLRLHPSKDMAYILDFTGCILNEGMYLPADIHDWENLPKDSGKECPVCNYVNSVSANQCAECGHQFVKIERAAREPSEEETLNMDVESIFDMINNRRDDRRLIEVRGRGTSKEDCYKYFKQRAFLNNNSPGKAFVDFQKEFNHKPDFAWDKHAVFPDPIYNDVLDYYCYLKSHQALKNKPFSWVANLMRNEFGEFLTPKRWQACINTFASFAA